VAPCSNAASPRPCTARARLLLCSAVPRPSLPRHSMPAPPLLHAVLTSREVTAPYSSTTRPPLNWPACSVVSELQHCHKTPLASRQPARRPLRHCSTSHVHSAAAARVLSPAALLLRPAEPLLTGKHELRVLAPAEIPPSRAYK
jgi:hypothetical protein